MPEPDELDEFFYRSENANPPAMLLDPTTMAWDSGVWEARANLEPDELTTGIPDEFSLDFGIPSNPDLPAMFLEPTIIALDPSLWGAATPLTNLDFTADDMSPQAFGMLPSNAHATYSDIDENICAKENIPLPRQDFLCNVNIAPRRRTDTVAQLVQREARKLMGISYIQIAVTDPLYPQGLRNYLPLPCSVELSGLQANGFWSANWNRPARHPANQDFVNQVTRQVSERQGNLCHASEEASRRAARTYFESLRRVYKCNTSPSALKKHSHKRAHHRVSLREKRKRAQSIMSSLTK